MTSRMSLHCVRCDIVNVWEFDDGGPDEHADYVCGDCLTDADKLDINVRAWVELRESATANDPEHEQGQGADDEQQRIVGNSGEEHDEGSTQDG